MADLSERRPDERGQLLLVTALGMAFLLVALTVTLNGAIATGNRVAEGGVDERDALEYPQTVERTLSTLLADTNRHHHGSYDDLRTNVTARVDEWTILTRRHAAPDGEDRAVEVTRLVEGSAVAQTNASRALTSATGAPDWAVVDGATSFRSVRFTVTRSSLVDADGRDENASRLVDAGAFAFVVADDGGPSRVFVYQDGSNEVLVRASDDGGALGARCSVRAGADDAVALDVSNGTLDGVDCPGLAVAAVDGTATLRFERGDNATGTYGFVVDRPVGVVADGDVRTDGKSPFVEPRLYAAGVHVTYVTPSVRYSTDRWVDPAVTVPAGGEDDG